MRASAFRVLSVTLVRPPEQDFLDKLAKLPGSTETEFGTAVLRLSNCARAAKAEAVAREYQRLFIGLGRGELLPYASYYLTGFLHEKPLAKLRNAFQRLGIGRSAEVYEPEDHIATLCEVMLGLIHGHFGAPATVEVQKQFFVEHLESWAQHFFTDLENAKGAEFYASIGTLGRVVMEIESEAFAMED